MSENVWHSKRTAKQQNLPLLTKCYSMALSIICYHKLSLAFYICSYLLYMSEYQKYLFLPYSKKDTSFLPVSKYFNFQELYMLPTSFRIHLLKFLVPFGLHLVHQRFHQPHRSGPLQFDRFQYRFLYVLLATGYLLQPEKNNLNLRMWSFGIRAE